MTHHRFWSKAEERSNRKDDYKFFIQSGTMVLSVDDHPKRIAYMQDMVARGMAYRETICGGRALSFKRIDAAIFGNADVVNAIAGTDK